MLFQTANFFPSYQALQYIVLLSSLTAEDSSYQHLEHWPDLENGHILHREVIVTINGQIIATKLFWYTNVILMQCLAFQADRCLEKTGKSTPNCTYMLLCWGGRTPRKAADLLKHPEKLLTSSTPFLTWRVKQAKFMFFPFVSVKFPRKVLGRERKRNEIKPRIFFSFLSNAWVIHSTRWVTFGIKTSKPRGIKTQKMRR